MEDEEMRAYHEQEAQKTGESAYSLAHTNYFKVQEQMGEEQKHGAEAAW